MKKTLSIIAAAAAVTSQPVLADSITNPPAEPAVSAPLTFQNSSPDWSGFYFGGQIGYADGNTNGAGFGSDDIIGGFIAGYDYDLGQTVIGIGLDYDFTDIGVAPGVDVQNIFRARARAGYKLGSGLAYITGGYANANADGAGNDDGYFLGVGYEHLITDRISIGGEILYHEFNNFDGTATDLEATTVQVRAAFRF